MAQPTTSKILTSDGWVTIEKVQINTKVLCPDNTLSDVLAVYPRGLNLIYEITLGNKKKVKCDENQLWEVKLEDNTWHIYPLREIIRQGLKEKKKHKWNIVVVKKINGVGVYSEGRIFPIVDIQLVGEEQTIDIMIDHKHRSYITDNCICTSSN